MVEGRVRSGLAAAVVVVGGAIVVGAVVGMVVVVVGDGVEMGEEGMGEEEGMVAVAVAEDAD